jgi:hypothetical protein
VTGEQHPTTQKVRTNCRTEEIVIPPPTWGIFKSNIKQSLGIFKDLQTMPIVFFNLAIKRLEPAPWCAGLGEKLTPKTEKFFVLAINTLFLK